MNKEKMANLLVQLRKEKGLLQQEVADIFSVTPQAVSKWEKGESIPDIETLTKIVEFYNLSLEELLEGERKESSYNDVRELDQKDNKKTSVNLLPIIYSGVILLLFLIFSSFGFLAGWTDFDVKIYLTTYDIIFSNYYETGNVLILMATLGFIATCVMDILDGVFYRKTKHFNKIRNLFLTISVFYFFNLFINYAIVGFELLVGAWLMLIITVGYYISLFVIPYYKDQFAKVKEKEKEILVHAAYLFSILPSLVLTTSSTGIPGIFISLIPLSLLAVTLLYIFLKKEVKWEVFYLVIGIVSSVYFLIVLIVWNSTIGPMIISLLWSLAYVAFIILKKFKKVIKFKNPD